MADGNESNWWPGGPEPNRGPGGYADPRDSGARGGQPPWDQPSAPWDQPPPHRDQPPPHWDQPVQPVQPPWGGTDPARTRGPQRPDPQRPDPRDSAAGRYDQERRYDQEQRAGNPRRDPGQRGWADGRPDDRARQFSGEGPEAGPYPVAPGGRHRTGSPDAYDGHAGPGESRGPGRTMTYVGGGVLVAIMLVGAGLGLSRGGGGGSPASVPTEAVQANPSATQSGPGTPTVTARSLGGQQVEFSWSYANSASGDTFRVRNSGGQPSTVDKPDLVLSVAQGRKTCVQVQVISASDTASAESNQACWPS